MIMDRRGFFCAAWAAVAWCVAKALGLGDTVQGGSAARERRDPFGTYSDPERAGEIAEMEDKYEATNGRPMTIAEQFTAQAPRR